MADDKENLGGYSDHESTASLLRTTRKQIADLREREAAIRDRYPNEVPLEERELDRVLLEIAALCKRDRDLERKLLGKPKADI